MFDSGDAFEKIIEARALSLFNSDGTAASFDTRSDNKGPEPEGLVIGKAFGRTYAFIGLERADGIMVYDVSDPFKPFFVDYVSTSPTDIAPEGLLFVKEEDSPTGKPLLIVFHEVSSTTTIFEIRKKQLLSKQAGQRLTSRNRKTERGPADRSRWGMAGELALLRYMRRASWLFQR